MDNIDFKFLKISYFVLFLLVIDAQLIVETQKELWLLVNKSHSINCTVKEQTKGLLQLYWTRNASRLADLPSYSQLKEVRVNQTLSQLVFQNASIGDSGRYTCHAGNGSYSVNSTVSVHIGGKPNRISFTCLYLADENIVWFFPITKNDNENNNLSFKVCKSSTTNHWCTSLTASWMNTSCSQFNSTARACVLEKVLKHTIYIVLMSSENQYGKTFSRQILENPRQKCVNDHRPKVKVELIDANGMSSFFVSWHFPRGDDSSISRITVTSTKDSRQVISPVMNFKRCDGQSYQCTQKIPGKDLLPCTNYTICVKNVLWSAGGSPTSSCVVKTTKNNGLPTLRDVRISENKVADLLVFNWRDPKYYDKGPFFYRYYLEIDGSPSKSKHGKIRNGEIKLAFPKINKARGIFTVRKCTICGCGEKTIKSFEVQKESTPNTGKRSMKSDKSSFPTAIVVGVSCLILLILGIVLFFICKRQRRERPLPNTRDELQEMDDVVRPINHYDGVEEVPHYYDCLQMPENRLQTRLATEEDISQDE